jgi:hypothetical protein
VGDLDVEISTPKFDQIFDYAKYNSQSPAKRLLAEAGATPSL